MSEWMNDLSWSVKAFQDIIWPRLNSQLPGTLVHVEAATRPEMKHLVQQFDQLAGIDAWVIEQQTGIRGLASRIQVCPSGKPFDTFTIRLSRDSGAKTEYAKRKEAIEQGWLYPHLTMQAYITARNGGELLSYGVAKTIDIFNLIAEVEAEMVKYPRWQSNRAYIRRTNNASFWAVTWDSQLVLYRYPLPED